MRLARSARRDEPPRFTSVSFFPPRAPDAPGRLRKQDHNDSGGIWQVVFRQNEPVDMATAGPFLPVSENVPNIKAPKKVAEEYRPAASILPSGQYGEYARPEGVRRCQLPRWDGILEEPTCKKSGVRQRGAIRSSTASAHGRYLRGGASFWRRISTPKSGGVTEAGTESRFNRTGNFRRPDLRYTQAGSPSPEPPSSARERRERMSETPSESP